MKEIQLVDLAPQWRELRAEIMAAVERVLDSGQYILGEQVSSLEREVASLCGVAHGIGVANGTDALTLTLHAFGIGPGDEVITAPFTFFATAEAIMQTGATPVFADVDPRTYTLDPLEVERQITPRTKAIVPVHLFGQMADMLSLRAIADKYGLILVEDACQAIGAMRDGGGVGVRGDAAAFSFFPTKNLGTYGDGGMVVLHDGRTAGLIRRLRVHGSERKYMHERLGWNSRLDELHAAILRVKLTRLAAWTDERRALAARYDESLANLPLVTPYVPKNSRHVYHLYTIVTERRDELQKWLLSQGIGCGVYYPVPLHLQRALASLGYQSGSFPTAERLSEQSLSLPLYPGMSQADQDVVIERVRQFFTR